MRVLLSLANFRQHGNHCGKSYPSQCLCIVMNPPVYALLKSGHLTHPHFLFIGTSAAQDLHVKFQNALCAAITTQANMLPAFFTEYQSTSKEYMHVPFLSASPACHLLALPFSFCSCPVNGQSTAQKQCCEIKSKSSFLFFSPSYIFFTSLLDAGTVWGNSSACYARSLTR